MTRPDADWEKLGRWLAGESSPEETAAVVRWLEQHPTEAAALEAIDRAARKISPAVNVDVEAALRRVRARRHKTTPTFAPVTKPVRTLRRFEMYAAAAAIILVAGFFGAQQVVKMRAAAPEVGYVTGVGQRDSVLLDDGSMVLLGPSSRVSVRGRNVTLTGQAFFRVTHDASSPFTVVAGNTVIRDIGTEFSVDSDTTSQEVRVVVREGSVALSRGSDSVTLEQGDVGVAQTGRVEARRGAATADDLAWTRGQLVFRDTPMRQVAWDLLRWYGVELRMTDSTARRVFTGTYANERADRVLEAIGLALGAAIERRADTAFIAPLTPSK